MPLTGRLASAGLPSRSSVQNRVRAALEAIAEGGLDRVTDAQEEAAAAIHTVQAEAVAAIRATERAMVETLERFERVTRDAAVLEPAVRFARALMNPDELLWLQVAPDLWATLLGHLGRYLKSRGDPEAPPPDSVDKGLHDRVRYPSLYGQPRLRELTAWLVVGLLRPSHGGTALLTQGHLRSQSQAST